ncbi:hypothetical protein GCM10009570_21500 [Dietzia natronolimnaea]
MTGKREISPGRRRWLDRQREVARREREALGVAKDGRSRWAYSTRSAPQPRRKR